MSTQTQPLDIRQFITGHFLEVFETMLSLPAEVRPPNSPSHFTTRVTGSVGFGGDKVSGAVYLHLSAPFARECACAMLGLPPEEIQGDGEVNDVVGEMTNMLAGGLKSCLCDAGQECAVSTPAIIRGTAFEIEIPPDVLREVILFQSGNESVIVEAHIKYT